MLLGTTDSGEPVFIEEYAQQHMEIDHWVQVAKSIKARYGNIPFYCDTARPEHIARFRREGIRAKNADKAVLSGIEQVARRFKAGTLKIYKKDAKDKARFADEIYQYVWNERTGEPVKLNDDVLDALRYAVYTHYAAKKTARTADRRTIGIW